MPVQTSKSPLLAKLGNRLKAAAEAHKADPPEYGAFADLPPGIVGGIAQLVECKFTQIAPGKQNAGEYMFYAAGVVKSPVSHAGVVVEGLRTQISEPLFETPGRARATLEDHVRHVQNELKKLAGRDFDPDAFSGENLESTCAALREAAPHFRFRTWAGAKQDVRRLPDGKYYLCNVGDDGEPAGKPSKGPYATEAAAKAANPYAGREPMVNHQWSGLCDWGGPDAGVNGDVADATPAVNGAVDTEPAPAGHAEDEIPFDQLAADATGGDEEAQKQLLQLAEDAGVREAAEAAYNWDEVVAVIRAAAEGGEPAADEGVVPEEPPAEEPWEPKKEEVYAYKPVDPKTKKPVKKAVEVVVTAVNKKAATVDLRGNSNPKMVYKSVKWDALEQA